METAVPLKALFRRCTIRLLAVVCTLAFGASTAIAAAKSAPQPLSLIDAKIALGAPEQRAKLTIATSPKFKFAIIDAGFNGIEDWLTKNPKKASRVHYRKAAGKKAPSSAETHGFKVFDVARTIMPHVTFVLVEVDLKSKNFLKPALEILREEGVYFASMSIGKQIFRGDLSPTELEPNLKLIDEYGVTFFNSSGNYRRGTHFFDYRDTDGDGFLEFGAKDGRKNTEINALSMRGGQRYSVNVSWQGAKGKAPDLELQWIDREMNVLASKKVKAGRRWLNMSLKPKKNGSYGLRLLDKDGSGAGRGLRFSMFAVGSGSVKNGFFNGLESMGVVSQYESPFIVSVGSFGKGEKGKLLPSPFSSIGTMNSGSVGPHVLGPGQLLIDGKTINGTSYSTPFMAALYSPFATYNIKNVIEATSSHGAMADGLTAAEKSRWGMPQFSKILGDNACTLSNKVENVRHRFDAESLVMTFNFTRHCMESLDYYLYLTFEGETLVQGRVLQPGTFVSRDGKQTVKGWVKKNSPQKNITAEPIEIKVPLKLFRREQMGKRVTPILKIATLAHWEPERMGKVSQLAPITLPRAKPFPTSVQGAKAMAQLSKSVAAGAFDDGIDLAPRALKTKGLSSAERRNIYVLQGQAYLGKMDLAGMASAMEAALADGLAGAELLLPIGYSQLLRNDLAGAEKTFRRVLKDESHWAQAAVGVVLAGAYAKQDLRPELKESLGARWQGVEKSDDVHANALAMFSGRLPPKNLFNKVMKAFRSQPKKRLENAVKLGQAYYYIGQLSLLQGKPKEAKVAFERAKSSGTLSLEQVWAASWLKRGSKASGTSPKPKPKASAPTSPPTPSVTAPKPKVATAPPGVETFKDCDVCPEMISLPKGKYRAGDGKDVKYRNVTIAKPFAIGRYEVTFLQWDACVKAKACNLSLKDYGWGRGTRPAIALSWDDAQQYVAWLRQKTGKAYRLPSDTEWEYAARAGSTTRFPWGDEAGSGRAVCKTCGSPFDDKSTAPVGTFAPNAFGLHDTAGNVAEWVEDCCWAPAGLPHDETPEVSCTLMANNKVMRGGAWWEDPAALNQGTRSCATQESRRGSTGLRVVRSLP